MNGHLHAMNVPGGSSSTASSAGQNTVKPRLTYKRARRLVENDDYAAFARRILRAYARRVADGDVEALIAMTGLHASGYSWAEIGARLGITRQAAQQRWGQAS